MYRRCRQAEWLPQRVVSAGLRAVLRVAEVNRDVVMRRVDAGRLQFLLQDAGEALGYSQVLPGLFYRDWFFNPLNFSLPPFGRLRNHASRDGPLLAWTGGFALGLVPLEGFVCCFDVLSDSIAELHPVFVILVPSGDIVLELPTGLLAAQAGQRAQPCQ